MANTLKGFDGLITSIDYDNMYIYTLSDETIFVWDKTDYSLARTIDCSNDVEPIREISVNSKRIYAIGHYNFIVFGKHSAEVKYSYKFGCTTSSDFCCFFNDVEKIYLSIRDSHVIAIDKTDYMNTCILDEHSASVTSIVSDQDYIYTGSADQSINIWDKKNNYEIIATLTEHSGDVQLSVTDEYILSASGDRSFVVWDKATKDIIFKKKQAHKEAINWIGSWKHYILTMSSLEGSLKIWDSSTDYSPIHELEFNQTETPSIMINEGILYVVKKDIPGIKIINLEELLEHNE